jgi:NADP-dependent 3-hydroxy acid dehydrogenase YdfG
MRSGVELVKIRSQQRWLITGTSSGFGREIALAVLKAGGSVLATARRPDSVADLVTQWPDQCITHKLNVTDANQIADAIQFGTERLGGIDVLVNNAGYGMLDSVEEADDAAIRQMLEVNFFAAANMIRAVLPGMRSQRRGWIVNISSSGGRLSAPGLGYYSAAKHAIEGLSKALRSEVERLGIGVTVVEPGSFRTGFAGDALETRDRQVADYAETVGFVVGRVKGSKGEQAGDPVKAASAIVAALDADAPPRQLLLGSDAVKGVRMELAAEMAELERWAELGMQTAF